MRQLESGPEVDGLLGDRCSPAETASKVGWGEAQNREMGRFVKAVSN